MSLPVEIENLALLGWRMYPASRHSKAACFKGATDLATTDLDTLEMWHRQYGPCNWRVVMSGSGIWALDVDRPSADHAADGFKVMRRWVEQHGPLPECPRTRSGGGGAALIFRDAGHPICRRTGYPKPGLDPRHGRLTITVPPSIHLTTRAAYRWDRAPWDCSLPVAPDWLLDAVKPPPEAAPMVVHRVAASGVAERTFTRAVASVRGAGDGGRNAALNRAAFWLGQWVGAGELSEADCSHSLANAAREIGLDPHEIKATILSGLKRGKQNPMEIRA